MADRRAAYFLRTKSKARRAAFLKQETRRLNALRAAAACTVPPLPPSSDGSCAFTLAPNAENVRSQHDPTRPATNTNEGPILPGTFLRSLGPVRSLTLLVDFSDRPATERASAFGTFFTLDTKHLEEISYGRFTVTSDVHPEWIRMPRPASSYPLPSGFNFQPFIRDAVAAADPVVDFSRYDHVFVIATPTFPSSSNGWAFLPGRGASTSDGVEVRFVSTLQPDARFQPGGAHMLANHEFLHTMGLPDLRFSPEPSTAFDPMSSGGSGAHLHGWHKWLFGWLDPPQLTCLTTQGRVEETLTAIARPLGKKLVVVPVDPSVAYVVEARVRVGLDRAICDEGVLVYTVDSQLGNAQTREGRGVLNLKGTPKCGAGGAGAFRPGEAFEDARVKVEVLARDATAYRVRVTKK